MDVAHTGTTKSISVTHVPGSTTTRLSNGTEYRVRVRAVNSTGNSDWAVEKGMPTADTIILTSSDADNSVVEGAASAVVPSYRGRRFQWQPVRMRNMIPSRIRLG